MCIPSETMARLATLNLTPDQAAAVVQIILEVEKANASPISEKTKSQERQRRYYEATREERIRKAREYREARRPSETIKTPSETPLNPDGVSDGVSDDPASRARAFLTGEEVSILTPPKPTVSSPKTEASETLTPTAHLELVVGRELALEVIDHRRRMRRALTAGAAERLAGKLAQTQNPRDAARLMIDRGWQGFESKWLTNDDDRSRGRPGGNGKLSIQEACANELEKLYDRSPADMFEGTGPKIRDGIVRLLPAGRC